MLGNLNSGIIKNSLKQLEVPLQWFHENGNKTAMMLLDALGAISDNDKDTQTSSFLKMLKTFISARQSMVEKHADVVGEDFKNQTKKMSDIFSSIKAVLPHEEEGKTNNSSKELTVSHRGGPSYSTSSVFTSPYKPVPINKQAGRGMIPRTKKKVSKKKAA